MLLVYRRKGGREGEGVMKRMLKKRWKILKMLKIKMENFENKDGQLLCVTKLLSFRFSL